MKIGIIAVGTELLMGKTLNTNAHYLSKAINDLGHSVMMHLTIGDNPDRLRSSIEYMFDHVDMIITTGGLGPTQDDLTKEIIAETFNKKLIQDERAYNEMLERFKNFGVTMTKNNIKQALLPEDAIVLYNSKGTAPGFISEHNNRFIAALPGPPREMTAMFEGKFKEFLISKSEHVITSEYINLFGIGESSAEAKIDDIVAEQKNPSIAIYATVGQVSIRVTAFSSSKEENKKLLKPIVDQIVDRLKPFVISFGQVSLLDTTIQQLLDHQFSLATAESCTGGMIASEFINVSGASNYFEEGYVTYSNESKVKLLGVKEETLLKYGAVSEETCREMVEGLFRKSKADVCLSVTGIAGPTGGTPEKPVGLVYIGVKVKDKTFINKYNFNGDRTVIRRRSFLYGVNMIRKGILDL
jgi:nicotinamide-nucleotide amidase